MVRDGDHAGARIAALLLFTAAAVQYGWNAWGVAPLTGYDSPAHAANILFILDDGRLPRPQEGWSTFHPPLYYLAGAAVWKLLEPFGPRAVVAGLRAINAVSGLVMGMVTYSLVSTLFARSGLAWCAAALVLFVPTVQLAASTVGNEAFAAALGALALPLLLRLQRDPGDLRAAAGVGLFAGLALASKYNAAFIAAACWVPFARADIDRAALRAAGAALLVGAAVAGPVYVRNLAVAGTPLPMTRNLEPMRSAEAANVLRERRVGDYLWLDPRCLLRPSIHHVEGEPGPPPRRNAAMTNVWGLLYASAWYDAFGHRIPLRFHRDGVIWGPLLAVLGLVPTAAMVFGFLGAAADCLRSRLRAELAPLVVVWAAGLCAFVAFTWRAPSLAAVKSSYLLPLVVPGAVFFARAVHIVGARAGSFVLATSTSVALLAAVVFTHSLVLPPLPDGAMIARWRLASGLLPGSHIGGALDRLTAAPAPEPEAGP